MYAHVYGNMDVDLRVMPRTSDDFNIDEITTCFDILAEMAKEDRHEVKRIVEQEFKEHDQRPRHMRPFAEEWPEGKNDRVDKK